MPTESDARALAADGRARPLVPRTASPAIPGVIEKWEWKTRVNHSEVGIRRMKPKRGSCNRETGHIWFNVELAKKDRDCLEYLAGPVQAVAHLLERTHGDRFTKPMHKNMPAWRARRDGLNQGPPGHEQWMRP